MLKVHGPLENSGMKLISKFPISISKIKKDVHVWFLTRNFMFIIFIASKSTKSTTTKKVTTQNCFFTSVFCNSLQPIFSLYSLPERSCYRWRNNPSHMRRRRFIWNIKKKKGKTLIIHWGAISDRTTDSSQASHCMCGIRVHALFGLRSFGYTVDSESVNWNLSISWIELIWFDMSLTTN